MALSIFMIRASIQYVVIALLIALTSVQYVSAAGDHQLSMTWKTAEPQTKYAKEFNAEFEIKNDGNLALPANGWAIYYSYYPAPIIEESVTGGVKIERLQSDLFRIVPGEDFKGLESGKSLIVKYASHSWLIKSSDAPVGGYLAVSKNGQLDETVSIDIQCETIPESNLQQAGMAGWKVGSSERYDINAKLLSRGVKAAQVLPSPQSIQIQNGKWKLKSGLSLSCDDGSRSSVQVLASDLNRYFGISVNVANSTQPNSGKLMFRIDPSASPESYRLNVDASGISIEGDAAGVFYATRTLLCLVPASAWQQKPVEVDLPYCTISDAPRFQYRGLHLDSGRNFHSAETVRDLLDQMAMCKLNRLHLHFSEDEGWRIEIPSLPELTRVGARRGHTHDERDFLKPAYGSGPDPDDKVSAGNGFYSRAEYVDIVRYAHERQIEIIPEIELPGHARAAIVAMKARYREKMAAGDEAGAKEYLLTDPNDKSEHESIQGYRDNVVCVCQPGVMRFFEKVVDELAAMHREAGTSLNVLHIGGDEVPHGAWEKSPMCESFLAEHPEVGGVDGLRYWFLQRLYTILDSKNIKMAGWEEVGLKMTRVGNRERKEPFADLANKNVSVNAWNSVVGGGAEDIGYRLANAGYLSVLSYVNHLYFDMGQSAETDVPGAYWGGLVDLKTAFEVSPLDFTLTVRKNGQGRPVERSTAFRNSVKLTEAGKKNVIGIQGQLWSETVRSRAMLEEYYFPRVLALAERAWAKPAIWESTADINERDKVIDADYATFVATLSHSVLPRLTSQHIGYYLPRPGVKVEGGKIYANVEFTNLVIRYTTDGTTPTKESPVYKEPLSAVGTITLAAFDSDGRSSRTVIATK